MNSGSLFIELGVVMNLVKQIMHLKMHINIGAMLGLMAWFISRGMPL